MGYTISSTEFIVLLLLMLSLVVFAVCAVMVRDLLKSAIALGITSGILSIIMFLMKSYLAAVFELSVCAGLITVVFISTISLTEPQTSEEAAASAKRRIKRFIYLPFILLVIGLLLFFFRAHINANLAVHPAGPELSMQEILWNSRRTDIVGQIIIMLAGVFGVVILFKERDSK